MIRRQTSDDVLGFLLRRKTAGSLEGKLAISNSGTRFARFYYKMRLDHFCVFSSLSKESFYFERLKGKRKLAIPLNSQFCSLNGTPKAQYKKMSRSDTSEI